VLASSSHYRYISFEKKIKMKLSTATLLAVVLPTVAIAFQQPAAIRYNGVVRHRIDRRLLKKKK
jgi:hypothetical protein